MGDSMSWAADQEYESWLNSPEYKVRHALCSRHNAAIATALKIKLGNLDVEELKFIISRETYIDPTNRSKGIYKEDVERLEAIVAPYKRY